MTVYNDKNLKQGRLLAHGRGMESMLDISYRKGWSEDNTILVVDNTNDLDSKWRIYEGVKNG